MTTKPISVDFSDLNRVITRMEYQFQKHTCEYCDTEMKWQLCDMEATVFTWLCSKCGNKHTKDTKDIQE